MTAVDIGEFTFRTKKDASEHIRAILHTTTPGTSVVGGEYDFIRGLLDHHPCAAEKIGCGVATIEVESIKGAAPGFMLTRTDGSRDDFSYKRCLHGEASHHSRVVQAMRNEVQDQIDAFRRNWFAMQEEPICELTGQKLRMGPEAHVDHLVPFREITSRFLAAFGGASGVQVTSSQRWPGTELSDRHVAQAWRIVHSRYPLRVVHRSGNLMAARKP